MRGSRRWVAPVLGLLVLCAATGAAAQEPEPAALSDKDRAREQRIEEYLRKREERRARRDLERLGAESAAVETATAAPAPAKPLKSKLPRDLAAAQAAVRASALGGDPSVVAYLELVDRREATAPQLAAFGSFLADGGFSREALVYYRTALDLDPDDPLLWLNYGSIQNQLGDASGALSAFGRTLRIDPNNAQAHYNVGSVLDARGEYEEAIEAFIVALSLDPSLGDPKVNPQAANNERLLVVKTRLYQSDVGRSSLPLVPIPDGAVEPEPEAEPPPD